MILNCYTVVDNQSKKYEILRAFFPWENGWKMNWLQSLFYHYGLGQDSSEQPYWHLGPDNFLLWGVSLCIVNSLPASLPCSTRCQWYIIRPLVTTKTVSGHFQIFLWKPNHSWLRTTGLNKLKKEWKEKKMLWEKRI